jgi:hypothetical protein
MPRARTTTAPDGVISFSKGAGIDNATTDKTSSPTGEILLTVPVLAKDGSPAVYVIPDWIYAWIIFPINAERGWQTF